MLDGSALEGPLADQGVGEGGAEGAAHYAGDFFSGDFEAGGVVKGGVLAEQIEGADAEGPGDEAGEADAEGADGLDVEAGVFEMLEGLAAPGFEEGGCAEEIVAEVSGMGDAEGAEVGDGEVAAAFGDVFGEIAEDVYQLQALAEAAAEGPEIAGGKAGVAGDVGGADAGPEFADAAGYQVGVLVEIGGGFQRADFEGVGETEEVEFLAAGDFFEEGDDFGAIGFGQGFDGGDYAVEVCQEILLGGVLGFDAGQESEEVVALVEECFGERAEGLGAEIDGGGGGVGDGIAGAGEKIGEADGAAEGAREGADGEDEAAGYAGEDFEEFGVGEGVHLSSLTRVMRSSLELAMRGVENRGGTAGDYVFRGGVRQMRVWGLAASESEIEQKADENA
jgi:hypothetical protein